VGIIFQNFKIVREAPLFHTGTVCMVCKHL